MALAAMKCCLSDLLAPGYMKHLGSDIFILFYIFAEYRHTEMLHS